MACLVGVFWRFFYAFVRSGWISHHQLLPSGGFQKILFFSFSKKYPVPYVVRSMDPQKRYHTNCGRYISKLKLDIWGREAGMTISFFVAVYDLLHSPSTVRRVPRGKRRAGYQYVFGKFGYAGTTVLVRNARPINRVHDYYYYYSNKWRELTFWNHVLLSSSKKYYECTVFHSVRIGMVSCGSKCIYRLWY